MNSRGKGDPKRWQWPSASDVPEAKTGEQMGNVPWLHRWPLHGNFKELVRQYVSVTELGVSEEMLLTNMAGYASHMCWEGKPEAWQHHLRNVGRNLS